MKRFICLALIFCLLCLPSVQVFADTPTQVKVGYVTYRIQNGVASVYTCDDNAKGIINISSSVNGYPVTFVWPNAFSYCYDITEVWLPNSIEIIHGYAFDHCIELTKVKMPDTVTSIGPGAFQHCRKLKDVIIPSGVETIDTFTYYHCYALTNIRIPGNISAIGGNAFAYNTDLDSVRLEEGVTTIGSLAFNYCNLLSDVYIPSTLKTIDSSAFSECGSLRNLYIADLASWCAIDLSSHPFSYSSHMTHTYYLKDNYQYKAIKGELVIPDEVPAISASAFEYADFITSVMIPGSVNSIGNHAFASCDDLTSITFKGDAPSFGVYTFYNTTATAYYPQNNTTWTDEVKQAYGGNITWVPYSVRASVTTDDGTITYNTLSEALSECENNARVQLLSDVEENITISQNIILDLNGFDIVGDVTVKDDAKVLLKDSMTDDYTIADAYGYGRITGTIEGVRAEDGYLMIDEEDGVSFHRLNLDAAGVAVRASCVGMYYQNQFGGDEVIKRNVVAYGAALGAGQEPDFREMTYTRFDDMTTWNVGMDDDGNSNNLKNGTILAGIMGTDNTYSINKRNATIKIYSQAYVELIDGTIIKSACSSCSLRELVEGTEENPGVDQYWETLTPAQQNAILDLYTSFKLVMQSWNIPNIQAAAKNSEM